MTAAVLTSSMSGLNATSTLKPMAMKQAVSKLLCSLRRIKLVMVPAKAHVQTKMNKPHPQKPSSRSATSVMGE